MISNDNKGLLTPPQQVVAARPGAKIIGPPQGIIRQYGPAPWNPREMINDAREPI